MVLASSDKPYHRRMMMFLEDMVVDVAHFQSLKLVTDFYEYITINNSYLPPYCCGD
jgi:hypothetical protein